MLCEVSPVLHKYPDPKLEVSVDPLHKVVCPDGTVLTNGSGFSNTGIAEAVLLEGQPLLFATVT